MWTISPDRTVTRRLAVGAGLLAIAAGLYFLAPGRSAPGAAPEGAVPKPPLRTVAIVKKELALTFDISWGTVMPPKVIAILVREKVPATFFLSGPWSGQHPELVALLKRDGFQIESHGQAHVNYSGLSNAQVQENISKAQTILEQVAGTKTDMVRPPNGDYNRRTLQVAESMGYTVVLWGTDSRDWMNPGVGAITSRVLRLAHPGDVVLLHASDTCKQTDLALPAIISGLRSQGYQFVTVDQLLQDAKAAQEPQPAA
ncbi:MAG: polysaccharide deacetylase family protein [Thermaerobacter sp.]|nr:polysaccharide deacetylase family protein [Thermaerobacter sp.]